MPCCNGHWVVRFAVIVMVMLIAGHAFAQGEPLEKWRGEAEAGLLLTGGNSDTEIINARLAVAHNVSRKWKNEFGFETLYSEDSGETSAERYDAFAKSDYKFTASNYGYAKARYENDRFAGYSYRVSESVGYGRYLLKSESFTLQLEAGPGATQVKLNDGKTEEFLILSVAGSFQWNFTKTAAFKEKISSDIAEGQAVTESVTTLQTLLVGNLSLKSAFSVRDDSGAPPGVKRTDSRTSLTLVISF